MAAVLGLAGVYFGAAKLGLSLSFAVEQVTLVWPPTGIALAAVLLLGHRVWPGIWLGAFAANALVHEPLATACAIAVGNTLEALTGAWLLRRVGFRTTLDEVKDVLALAALAAVASTMVSATIGTASLLVSGLHPWTAFGYIWWAWWIGDAISALVVAPILLTGAAWLRRPSWHRLGEAFALLALLVVAISLVGSNVARWIFAAAPPRFVVFPFIIWGALRFGPPGAAAVTFISAAVSVWGTLRGSGSWASEPVETGLIILHFYFGVVAISGLLLAAAGAQRRRAEEAARRSEQHLRAVIDSARTGSWSYDAMTGQVRWSEQVEAIHGLPPGGFGGTVEAYAADIHAEDRERVLRGIAASVETGIDHDLEYRIVRPDGELRWIHGQGRVLNDGQGRAVGMTGLCTDITERKRAEEALQESETRLKSIIDSAMDAVVTIDQQERIRFFNAAAEQMFRCERGEAIGSPLERFIPVAVRGTHHEHIRRFGRAGVTSRTMGTLRTLRALRADGEEFPMEATISQTSVGGEKLFTVIIRDVSERVQAEQEREALLARELKAHAELQALNRAKDEFLAVLGHELRNPLAAMSAAISVLNRLGFPGDATARLREILSRQARQLRRLVDDLLDVARLESGKLSLQRHAVDLRAVAERCVAAFQETERGRRHRMETTGGPALVAGDPARLEQIVANLVDNAVKFTPAGGRIGVSVEGDGDCAVLHVRDTGVGIAPGNLSRIFEPFVQAEPGIGRAQGGLGLGLPLVARLVRMHGGTVSAASPGPDQGSEFTVRLPLLDCLPTAAARGGSTARSSVPRRLLIVEDNADARDALTLLLEMWGHSVEAAEDGLRGREQLLTSQPDIALVDLGLPGLDGYALAREVRAKLGEAAPYLVALTGYGQPEDRRRARLAGFDAHLVKPVDEHELLSLVAAVPPREAPDR